MLTTFDIRSSRTCEDDINKLKVQFFVYFLNHDNTLCSKEKWFAVLHHVVNEHHWLTGLQQCEHDVLTGSPTDNDGRELHYFNKREAAFGALQKLVTDKRWLKSLKYYTKFR